ARDSRSLLPEPPEDRAQRARGARGLGRLGRRGPGRGGGVMGETISPATESPAMDFVTVEGRALKHAMAALMGAVNLRTIPVLGCIKLSLFSEGLRLEATDLDVVVIAHVDVIDGAGEWSL